jgi:vancomycin resistance protein VanJ
LQEARRTYPPQRAGENDVGKAISPFFPGWHRQSAGDTCILSRFPILSSSVHPLRLGRRTLDVRLQTPQGPLRVLSTHISTAFKGQAAYRGLAGQLREIIPNAQKAAQARLDQIAPLDQALDSDSETPLVLCGDFNTPPRGLFYRHLHWRLDDAFAYSGNGLGLTFPTRFPLLRIDYVWTRGVRATSVYVAPQGESDHRMVVADIQMK